jgi:opacity protein-like surface antigen
MLVVTPDGFAQPGGKAFQFLEVANSARVAALGGQAVAIYENDLDMPYHNPALLNQDMHHRVVLNYVNYFAGINYGYASAAARLGAKGTIAGGVHYLNYGRFQGADESGSLTGTFRAADYSVNCIYARSLDSLFTWGFTVKSIFSDLESYHATAIALDAGITYHNPEMKFTAGLVFRNIGWQVQTYYPDGDHEPLPFNISAGITQGLRYAPLTFYLVADHLEKWDLTYETEADKEKTVDPLTGEQSKTSGFDRLIDKGMRHVIVGAEFSLGQNLAFRLGYNYRRRQEMKIDTKPGLVGFSWGIGLKISRFQFSYGRPVYHLAGGANYFSFSMNLDEFGKKF